MAHNEYNWERIDRLYQLWESENHIKTNKLYHYFISQSVLFAALSIFHGTFHTNIMGTVFVCIFGILLSIWSFFSIARTVQFQKYWKSLIENKAQNEDAVFFPSDNSKQHFSIVGSVPSKYIVQAPPIVTSVLWVIILLWIAVFR